ncbi:MAG: hypothetical protein AAGA56_31185, partial [Myxococcota bacterium]
MRKWLGRLAELGMAAPRTVLGVAFVFLAVFGAVGANTPINTARHTMVSPDNPHQKKQIEFFDRFGLPNGMILVLEGGSRVERERAVMAIQRRLGAETAFTDRVLGRVGPEQVAELLLVRQPELAPLVSDPTLLNGGVSAWIDSLAARMEIPTPSPPKEPTSEEGVVPGGV